MMAADQQKEYEEPQEEKGGDEQPKFDDAQQPDDNAVQQKMQKSDQIETNWDKVDESFDHKNLREDLIRGIYAYGFEKPSAIQHRGIIPVIQKRDTIAQAQSGTGKTATFSIAELQSLDLNEPQCQVLVLAPTRELAQQIHKVWSLF
eukprot:74784_1